MPALNAEGQIGHMSGKVGPRSVWVRWALRKALWHLLGSIPLYQCGDDAFWLTDLVACGKSVPL